MLVISQKEGEELRLGAEISIRVLAVGKGRVKLGISAPAQLKITRTQKSGSESKGEVTPQDQGQIEPYTEA